MAERRAPLGNEDVELRVHRIVEAAGRVIALRGFGRATVEQVAEEAHVAKGTIYLYFPSKEHLLRAAVLEGLRTIAEQTRQEDRPDLPPFERFKALVATMLRVLGRNQSFLKAILLESRLLGFGGSDARGIQMRRLYAEHIDLVASIIKSAIEAGVFRPIDPKFASFLFIEMLTSSLRRRFFGVVNTPAEKDAEELLDLFLNGVRAVPPSIN